MSRFGCYLPTHTRRQERERGMAEAAEGSSTEEGSVIRGALHKWHGLLNQDPVTRQALAHAGPTQQSSHERPPIAHSVQAAATHLASSLEDLGLQDGLIDDILSIVTTITGMCGVELTVDHHGSELYGQPGTGSSSTSSSPLNPAKAKLFKDGTGLPVHKTSIGRRASASYCVYESIGGWETLSAAVESLYNRMQSDQRCASLFQDANEKSLKALTLEFLTCSLGGKDRFASSTMLQNQRDQLRRHGFGTGQFDAMLQHLKAVLEDLSVQQEVAASAVALLRCNRFLFELRPTEDAGPDAA